MWYWSKNWIKWVFFAGLFTWALLSLLLHLSLPWLDNNTDKVNQWASEQLGTPVSIQQLETGWVGFGPILKMSGVQIGTGSQASYIGQAVLDLTWRGLRVTADKLQLNLLRSKQGRIEIQGLPNLSSTNGDTDAFDLPFSQLLLRQAELQWHDQQLGLAPLNFTQVNVVLRQRNGTLRIRGQLESDVGTALFAANLHGQLNSTEWSGDSYIKLQTLSLADTLIPYLPKEYQLKKGYLDLQLWQQWQAAQPVQNQGQFTLRELPFDTTKQWHSQFAISAIDSGWQLALNDQQLGRIAAGYSADKLQVAAEKIDIAILRELLDNRLQNPDLQQALQGLQPSGYLTQVRLSANLQEATQWTLNSHIQQLSVKPWQNIPGINNLDAQLSAQADRANLQLNGKNIGLDYRQLFRTTLQLSRLEGMFYWLADDAGTWRLHSDALKVETPHLHSESHITITQPAQGPTHIALHSLAGNTQIREISTYLPAHIMGEELVEWLDSALTTGNLETTQILLNGPVDTFPYHQVRNGAFEVLTTARNTPLDYQAGWPRLQDVDAHLHFYENSLDIKLLKGHIYNSALTQATAHIESLEPTSPVHIKGELQGALSDTLQILKEDALKANFGEIADALKASGRSSLSLDFRVPLQSGIGDYALDGKLKFLEATLALPEWNLNLDNIQGTLNINLDKLHAKGISAHALGSKISVDVLPYPGHTLVHASGNFSRNAIAKQFPQIPLQPMSGRSAYHIEVEIPSANNQQATNQLHVHSDLLGTQIKLPAPFGKTADSTKLFYLNLPLDSKSQQANHIRYGEQLDARFSQDWQRGGIHYASGVANVPNQPGYQLNAKFKQLDIAAWQQAINNLQPKGKNHLPWQANIQADRASHQSLSFDKFNAKLNRSGNRIKGKLNSQQIAGNFTYQTKPQALLDIQLEYAHFNLDTETPSGKQPPDPTTGPDPRQLPAMQLQCDDLQINQARLGRLTLNTQKTAQGLDIEKLQVEGDNISLDIKGNWQQQAQAATTLNGRLQAKDFGQLLENLGFARHVYETEANIGFNLSWPGSPAHMHKASLKGNLDIDIKKGRLAEVEPGIMRVLSLLSLDALTRMLRFDLTNLFYEGYAFDRMQGLFELEDSYAYTYNFLVAAASADMEFGGRTGLINKDFELVVHATPKLDAVLPIIGAVTGGPVGGIAGFLLQQILAKEVNKLSLFVYSVTGSWDEPRLIPLEGSGALSSIVNSEEVQGKTEQQKALLKPREGKNLPAKPSSPDHGEIPNFD